jgi:membrane protease YdiL (CAAX protease family)
VLYRHLRGATAGAGRTASIVLSGLVSAFIFAVIHPQGWVAIPALMSLALAFVILREWRGTLIPCMIVHGISNFLVMSMVILVLRA